MCEHMAWGSLLKMGSHHIAHEFVRRGHEVFWLATPIHIPRNPLNLFMHRETRLAFAAWMRGVRRHGRLTEVLPFSLLPWVDLPLLRSRAFAAHSLKSTIPGVSRVLRAEGFDAVDLLWLTYPYLSHVRRMVGHRWLIHRITDDYAAFPGVPPSLAAAEAELTREAHLVVTAAASAANRSANTNTRYMPNGVNLDAMNAESLPARPEDYGGLSGRIFVYTGGIYEAWVDYRLVAEMARRFPNDNVVLVGPHDRAAKQLGDLPNVRLTGARPHSEMASYMKWADVGIIPWKDSPTGRAMNPLKLLEYCACGLPVVASRLPEIERLVSPAWLAGTVDEWEAVLRSALAPGPRGKGGEQLIAYARENTWQKWVDKLFTLYPLDRRASRGA